MADQQKLTIEILVGHCLGGEGNDVFPGEVIEAPGRITVEEALRKVRLNYAKVVDAGLVAPSAPPARPDVVSHADPVNEHRDPETEAPASGRGKGRAKTGKED